MSSERKAAQLALTANRKLQAKLDEEADRLQEALNLKAAQREVLLRSIILDTPSNPEIGIRLRPRRQAARSGAGEDDLYRIAEIEAALHRQSAAAEDTLELDGFYSVWYRSKRFRETAGGAAGKSEGRAAGNSEGRAARKHDRRARPGREDGDFSKIVECYRETKQWKPDDFDALDKVVEKERDDEGNIDWQGVENIIRRKRGKRFHSAEDCRKFWEAKSATPPAWDKAEEKKLIDLACQYQGHDWQSIARDLGTGRLPIDCLRKHEDMCHKDRPFTAQEDELLTTVVQQQNNISDAADLFDRVGNYIPGRTAYQCRVRWRQIDPTYKESGRDGAKWKEKEGRRLALAARASADTAKNVVLVPDLAAFTGTGRNYLNYKSKWSAIDPRLKVGKFTKREDEMLRAAMRDPARARDFVNAVPGRSRKQTRYRWTKMLCAEAKKNGGNRKKQQKEPRAQAAEVEELVLT